MKKTNNLKRIVLTIGLGIMSMGIFAQQQIYNSDFEEWESLGGSNGSEPKNWNSFKTAGGTLSTFAKVQVEESSDVRPGSTGSKSARIWTLKPSPLSATLANGNLTLGKINMGDMSPTGSSNYNYSKTDDSEFSEIMTDYPDSIVFWAKFTPIGNTNAKVKATIHDNYNYRDPENTESSNHVVATAELSYPSTNGQWVRFALPFYYTGPATDAQFILITFTSCEIPGGGAINDEVLIDDVELIYNDNAVSIAPTEPQLIYENQNGNPLTVTATPNAASSIAGYQWKFATTSGGPYSDLVGETSSVYTPNAPDAGTYYIVCEVDFGTETLTTEEVIIQVIEAEENIVSVTPNNAQTLVENQIGNVLTAAEVPAAANSRQWKYATTAGGPYTDLVGETGLSYAPTFSSTGTYYVICESTFETIEGDEIKQSNEVTVNVIEFTVNIAPIDEQTIEVETAGSQLTVAESVTVDSREWKYSTTSGSGYTSFDVAQTGSAYTPQFDEVGTYYVVCESKIDEFIEVSNEVKIIVIPAEETGIEANTLKNIIVFSSEQDIVIDFSSIEQNGEVEVLNLQGQVVSNSTLNASEVNRINLSVQTGIYLYRIQTGGQFYTGKVFIK